MLRKMIAGLVLVGFVAGCAEEAKKPTPAKGAAPAAGKTEEKKK